MKSLAKVVEISLKEFDMRKNTVIECATLCIKENILNSLNLIFKLE